MTEEVTKNDGVSKELPKALYGDEARPLEIGDMEIPCYVLEDERRVLSQRGIQASFGMSSSAAKGGARRLAHLVASIEAIGVDSKGLSVRANSPIEFILPNGGRAIGYEATILPDLCEFLLAARRTPKALKASQLKFAHQAEILLGAFARVGIIALVDEATGYQSIRKRRALETLLKKYISDKLLEWAKTFPDEFYDHIFRLNNWSFSLLGKSKRPGIVGKYTRDIVYDRLAPGVRQRLEEVNPIIDGRRRFKHFQWLTEDIGNPALKNHLIGVIALLKAAPNWGSFKRMLQRVYPKYGEQPELDWPEDAP